MRASNPKQAIVLAMRHCILHCIVFVVIFIALFVFFSLKLFVKSCKVFTILKDLKPGQMFTMPDGTELRAEDVMDPQRDGRKVR